LYNKLGEEIYLNDGQSKRERTQRKKFRKIEDLDKETLVKILNIYREIYDKNDKAIEKYKKIIEFKLTKICSIDIICDIFKISKRNFFR
jgi:acyl-[acyl carrier protein]--UDP-N-acetylglucosamine O-acyltransferase